jgi:hypothetical protein
MAPFPSSGQHIRWPDEERVKQKAGKDKRFL